MVEGSPTPETKIIAPTALFVDDEDEWREGFPLKAAKIGCQATAVDNLKKASEMVKEHPEEFKVVVLDGYGGDFQEFVAEMVAVGITIPIRVLSGDEDLEKVVDELKDDLEKKGIKISFMLKGRFDLKKLLEISSPKAPEKQEESPYAKCAYLIDDDALIKEQMSLAAETIDCQTRTFGSVEEFLAFLKTDKNTVIQEHSLILTDGFDVGFQAIVQALWSDEATKRLPLRLLSGDTGSLDVAKELGIPFVAKQKLDIKEVFKLPLRVLVVEDEPIWLDGIREELFGAGWGVKVAGTIEEALRILGEDDNFDLICTDGFDTKCLMFKGWLAENKLNIPWVILSGDTENLRPLAEEEKIPFINKTETTKDLPSLLRQALKAPQDKK